MSEVITVIISGLFSILGSLIVVSVALKKAPVENQNTEADTAGKYQELAHKAAEDIRKLREEVDLLQEQIEKLECQVNRMRVQLQERTQLTEKLKAQISDLMMKIGFLERSLAVRDRLIEQWQGGIMQLLHQLEMNQITPVWKVTREELAEALEREKLERKGKGE